MLFRSLVFTSPAGVHTFFQMLCDSGRDVRVLGGMTLAVIGEGTKSALREYGLLADLMPEVYDGTSLGTLLGECLPDGSRVLIPRSSIGNPKLISCMVERAKAFGKTISVTDLAVYETLTKQNEMIPTEQLFEKDRIDGVFFTSASTVRAFVQTKSGDRSGEDPRTLHRRDDCGGGARGRDDRACGAESCDR